MTDTFPMSRFEQLARYGGTAAQVRENGTVVGSIAFKLDPASRTVDWLLVWAEEPPPPFSPYSDGYDDGFGGLAEELSTNVLILGGVRFDLEWLAGPEQLSTWQAIWGEIE